MDLEYLVNVTAYILKGCILTFKLYSVTALFSLPVGMIFALGKVSKIKPIKLILDIYTWVFRGTPLMLQVFFTYFGLPVIGIRLSPFAAAAVTYILNYAAYITEIFRGGIESIDRGQYEAAKALGMNYFQTMRSIILPQTVKRILPPTCNEAINLVKDTAIVAAIGMGDLLRNAKEIVTRDFRITPFFIAAVIYLLMSSAIVLAFKKIEKSFSYME